MKKLEGRSLDTLEQTETPYFDALLRYVEEDHLPFHVPGHKQGKGAHPKIKEILGEKVFELDLCSGLEGIDDHSQPTAVLMEAEHLAARAYGADQTFFLTNGSTQGNYAMLMSFVGHNEKVIIPRNAHRSIASALILSGAIPVYVIPEVDDDLRIAHNVTPESVERALVDHPDAKAVLLVSPTYYGVACDMKRIAEIVHAHGKPLLVDEAWGPHFAFHPLLPESALSAGADVCVTGIHKLLGSFTQSSMLHVRTERADIAHVNSILRIIQSTSPSCLLLASLDVARMQMATEGERLLQDAIELADEARARLSMVPGLYSFGREILGRPGVAEIDPTRLTVQVVETGFSGYAVDKILRRSYGVQVELSDLFNVLFNVTIGDRREDMGKLVEALSDFAISSSEPKWSEYDALRLAPGVRTRVKIPHHPEQAMTPREAFFSPHEKVPLDLAAGRVCSEIVASYPPGIPALSPGEIITPDLVSYLKAELDAGIYIQGPEDPSLDTLKVVAE
ncbi:MAG: aminotransferase class I/II-fold pyridoxal phosphate-dependent enzyme [Candidatus Aquicultorales bacterium]